MVVMVMDSVILVRTSLENLMSILIVFQQSHFLYKIHSNALPLKHVVLGGKEKL